MSKSPRDVEEGPGIERKTSPRSTPPREVLGSKAERPNIRSGNMKSPSFLGKLLGTESTANKSRVEIQLSSFPEEVREILAEFDTSNDGYLDRAELEHAAYAYRQQRRLVSRLLRFTIVFFVILMILCGALAGIIYAVVVLTRQMDVNGDTAVMTVKGSSNPVKVLAASTYVEAPLSSYHSPETYLSLRQIKLSAPGGGQLSLQIQGAAVMPDDAIGQWVALITQAGTLYLHGSELTFDDTVAPLFQVAGLTVSPSAFSLPLFATESVDPNVIDPNADAAVTPGLDITPEISSRRRRRLQTSGGGAVGMFSTVAPLSTVAPTPKTTTPAVTDPLPNALKLGDSSSVTGNALRAAINVEISRITTAATSIANAIASSGNKLTNVTWDPTHDSVTFTITDTSNTFPIISTNYKYYPPAAPEPLGYVLGAAGNAIGGTGGRFFALGMNPLYQLYGATGGQQGLQNLTRNIITWLNGGVDPATLTTNFTVVVAHFPGPSSYYFSHDANTRSWVTSNFPKATVNPINVCDNAALPGCLATADLLIIGAQTDRLADTAANAATTDTAAVAAAVSAFSLKNKPILYMHFDGTATGVSTVLLPLFGISPGVRDNYWSTSGLYAVNSSYVSSVSSFLAPYTAQLSLLRTLNGTTPALNETDITGCATVEQALDKCTAPGFVNKVYAGANEVKKTLVALDQAGVDLFSTTGNKLIKLWVLLGDKYRSGVADPNTPTLSFPIPRTDLVRYTGLIFADFSVLYKRKLAPAQGDLGTLACPSAILYAGNCTSKGYDYRTYGPSVRRYSGEPLNLQILPENSWTSTGLYAFPGSPVTFTRTDNVSAVTTIVYTWFQRDPSGGSSVTKPWMVETAGGNQFWRYHRPYTPRSYGIPILPGRNITFTSPYGGPIYIQMNNPASTYASNPATLIKFTVDNVAKHPAILDASDSAQVNLFVSNISINPLPVFDIKVPGFELHGRKDKLLGGIGGTSAYPNTTAGFKSLMDDIRLRYIEVVYTRAGYKVPGKSLNQSLPAAVLSRCASLNWPCTNETYNSRSTVQHANYDETANCGFMCSGNPYDGSGTVNPIGWGDNHEMGHNMQTWITKIGWTDQSVSTNTRDNWQVLVDRSIENSNNVFPYYTMWNYYRRFLGSNATITDTHTSGYDTFFYLQSSIAQLQRTVSGVLKNVVVDSTCTYKNTYAPGTSAARMAFDSIYSDGAYAATNGPRQNVWIQIALMTSGMTLPDGTVMSDGFDVYPILYSSSRVMVKKADSEANWLAWRNTAGFSIYNYTSPIYGSGKTIRDMPGNDYLVVALSRITGKDWRPFFNIRGIIFSSLVDLQLAAYYAASPPLVKAWPGATLFKVIDTDIPPLNLTSIATVPLNGTAAWPRTNKTVQSCA